MSQIFLSYCLRQLITTFHRSVVRDWMKAIMKAMILRDSNTSMCFILKFSFLIFNILFLGTVISSCNILTIPLVIAQVMDPAQRPPSPSARKAIQMALQ